jgi:hypothetical protein
MDTRVGPIQVEVLEPLQKLRIRVVDNDHGVSGELVFDARAKPVEEPRFIRRYGPRMIMDYTRMTQNGAYTGWIEVKDKRIEIAPDTMIGTRDRSWGVRPIGASDPQPVAPRRPPQTFWIWSPLNFRDAFMLYHLNDEASGKPWNTASSLGLLGDGEPTQMAECAIDIKYKSGTRHAKSALIKIADEDGRAWRAELDCKYNFYMCGIGYTHPEWGHGMYRGELDVGYDCFETAAVAENTQLFWHVQAFVTASLTGPDGVREGVGVLEQIAVGPHAPSGFKEIYDLAP